MMTVAVAACYAVAIAVAAVWLPFWLAHGIGLVVAFGGIAGVTMTRFGFIRTMELPPGPWVHLTPTDDVDKLIIGDGQVQLDAHAANPGPLRWPPTRHEPESIY